MDHLSVIEFLQVQPYMIYFRNINLFYFFIFLPKRIAVIQESPIAPVTFLAIIPVTWVKVISHSCIYPLPKFVDSCNTFKSGIAIVKLIFDSFILTKSIWVFISGCKKCPKFFAIKITEFFSITFSG